MKSHWLTLRDLSLMDIKEYYSSIWAWGGLLIATVLSLYVYWYTSLAFSPAIMSQGIETGMSYFTFIIVGELALMLPTLFLEAPTQVVKQAISSGAMTTLLQLPTAISTPLLSWTLAKAPTEILRLLMNLLLVFTLFGGVLGFEITLGILFLIFLTAPLFLGLGLLAAAIVVIFGRGERVISFAVNALSIFSGIYFPVSVLPDAVRATVQSSSPLYWILEKARAGITAISFHEILVVTLSGIFILFLGILILRMAFAQNQKSGTTWILRY